MDACKVSKALDCIMRLIRSFNMVFLLFLIICRVIRRILENLNCYTSAMLHDGFLAPNRPIGELCTNGKFGALDLLKRFLNSSFLACAPNRAAFGLHLSYS